MAAEPPRRRACPRRPGGALLLGGPQLGGPPGGPSGRGPSGEAVREEGQWLGGPGFGGDGLRGQGHQIEQRKGIGFGVDTSPARHGDHDRNDFGRGQCRRVPLVELVAQHVGVQADGPGQLLLGTPNDPQSFPQCQPKSNLVSHWPPPAPGAAPANKLMQWLAATLPQQRRNFTASNFLVSEAQKVYNCSGGRCRPLPGRAVQPRGGAAWTTTPPSSSRSAAWPSKGGTSDELAYSTPGTSCR